MSNASPAKEPSMDEILASIRRIIESGEERPGTEALGRALRDRPSATAAGSGTKPRVPASEANIVARLVSDRETEHDTQDGLNTGPAWAFAKPAVDAPPPARSTAPAEQESRALVQDAPRRPIGRPGSFDQTEAGASGHGVLEPRSTEAFQHAPSEHGTLHALGQARAPSPSAGRIIPSMSEARRNDVAVRAAAADAVHLRGSLEDTHEPSDASGSEDGSVTSRAAVDDAGGDAFLSMKQAAGFGAPLPDFDDEFDTASFAEDLRIEAGLLVEEAAVHSGIEAQAGSVIAETSALMSDQAGAEVAAAFDDLARAIREGQMKSMEDMAREMLRPMLQEWLDDNLPRLVERLVREEIERVARAPRR